MHEQAINLEIDGASWFNDQASPSIGGAARR
jgi:hypothetical protein